MLLAKYNKKRGFTLVELLVAISIVAIIGLAIYATFSSGIRVWNKIASAEGEEDIGIFFEKFVKDLRNSFPYSRINFMGAGHRLRFAAPIWSQCEDEVKKEIGRVDYIFDPEEGYLTRSQANYSEICEDEEAVARTLVEDVEDVRFAYYYYDTEGKDYLWMERTTENIPLAVKVEVLAGRKLRPGAVKWTRIIAVPVTQRMLEPIEHPTDKEWNEF